MKTRCLKGFHLGLFSVGFLFTAVCAQAQGMLPATSVSTTTASETVNTPILISEKVPKTLSGIDVNGKDRTLYSYYSPLEVLVVGFLSAQCGKDPGVWRSLRLLSEKYTGWHVVFLGASATAGESAASLKAVLERERLNWPVVRFSTTTASTVLQISGTPEAIVMDEFGNLRYRGPIDAIRPALNAVIGHVEAVNNPEPAFRPACALE